MDQQIERISSLFEKLIGITLSEITMGDYNEALNSLNGIENLLTEITTHKETEKVEQLFNSNKIRRTEHPLVKPNSKQNPRIIYKSFNEIIITGLSQVWKNAYLSERSEICLRSYEIMFNLLEFCQPSNKNYDLAYSILASFSDMTLFCSSNFNPKIRDQISNIGFHWYENWVYFNLQIVDDFSRLEYYYKLFRNMLWINLQHYIDTKSYAFIEPLLVSLFDGFRFTSGYFNSEIYSTMLFRTNNKELHEIASIIYKLSNEVIGLKNLTELKDWWNRFKTNNNEMIKIVETDNILNNFLENVQSKTKDSWENVLGVFFFNDLKQLLFFVASYALFVKNYRFIYEFWNFNQPSDAAAVNYGNRLLPETMNEIIDAFVNFDYFNTISDYHLYGHHEIGYYYKQYLTLLFLRQYTLPKLYTYQNFLSIDGIPNSVEHAQIDNYIENVNEFKARISFTLKNNKLLEKIKVNPELIFKDKPNPDEILDKLVQKLYDKKDIHEQKVELDSKAVQNFKSSVLEIYKKNSFYRNILVNLFNFKVEYNIAKVDSESVSFGIDEINIKNFLAKGDTGTYFGFSERYGQELSYQENNVIRLELVSTLKHEETIIENIIDILQNTDLSDKVIISRNIDFANEVFQKNKGFIPRYEVSDIDKEDPLYNVFSGKYEGCDIYTHYDEIGWKGFFIICKKGSGRLQQFKPGELAKKKDFINHILFKVDTYSDPNNIEMLNDLIKTSPSWLKKKGDKDQQEQFLKKQVRIRIAESVKVIFNKDFTGHFYSIK